MNSQDLIDWCLFAGSALFFIANIIHMVTK